MARARKAGNLVPAGNGKVAKRPYKHRSILLNGRRLSATISIDFKTFRQLILELAPHLSIDKVEVQ
jgi:hypothetical protein